MITVPRLVKAAIYPEPENLVSFHSASDFLFRMKQTETFPVKLSQPGTLGGQAKYYVQKR